MFLKKKNQKTNKCHVIESKIKWRMLLYKLCEWSRENTDYLSPICYFLLLLSNWTFSAGSADITFFYSIFFSQKLDVTFCSDPSEWNHRLSFCSLMYSFYNYTLSLFFLCALSFLDTPVERPILPPSQVCNVFYGIDFNFGSALICLVVFSKRKPLQSNCCHYLSAFFSLKLLLDRHVFIHVYSVN